MPSPTLQTMVLAMATTWASAQAATSPYRAPLDPYTRGDPAALAKAGYVSLGPFPFAAQLTTDMIEAQLANEPIAWIETAHFRIGCSLTATELEPDSRVTSAMLAPIRDELRRLQKRLPTVKPETKTLDPWLRAHLLAQRAEETFADVASRLHVDERGTATIGSALGDPEHEVSLGPHLGMQDKYRVLLLQRTSSHARLTRACFGRELADPVRWMESDVRRSLYFGGSEEAAEQMFHCEPVLRTHLAYNLAVNLYCGYRGYACDLPAWLLVGLGHWHARQMCPQFPVLERRDENDKDRRSAFWQWDKRIVGMVRTGAAEPLASFLSRGNPGDFRLEQHVESWSLVSFLIAEKPEQFAQFVYRMKAPFYGLSRVPTQADLCARQVEAVGAAFALDIPQLDAQWRDAVLDSRSKNRK